MAKVIVTKGKRTGNGIIFIGMETVDSDGESDYQIAVVDTYIDFLKSKEVSNERDYRTLKRP